MVKISDLRFYCKKCKIKYKLSQLGELDPEYFCEELKEKNKHYYCPKCPNGYNFKVERDQ